ncbi:MAG: peptidylprolyl isomerase [Lachnospiraceae bacterium]|jgi:hypothetical protein
MKRQRQKKTIKSGFFRRLVTSATLTILCICLAGCAEIRLAAPMRPDVLLSVNGKECPVSEAVFRMMEVREYYRGDEDELFWERNIGDITLDRYVKDSVKEEMIRITSSVLMSDEMALYMSDADRNLIKEKAEASFNEINLLYDLHSYGITPNTVISLYTKQAMYDKVFNKLAEKVNEDISKADTKVIEVNYVELPLSMSINQAEKLRSEIKSGTSFETACKTWGYEPVLNRVIMKGNMDKTFEKVAYNLIDGDLSEIVETAECLYIIECVEDYMISESVANKNKVISAARKAAFDEKFVEFSKGSILRFNEEAWERINVQTLRTID